MIRGERKTFYYVYFVYGKKCKLIINEGCGVMNVIFIHIFKKINIRSKSHLKLLHMSWPNYMFFSSPLYA